MTCLEIARIHHRDALAFDQLERVWAASPSAKEVYRQFKRRSVLKALHAAQLSGEDDIANQAFWLLAERNAQGWRL